MPNWRQRKLTEPEEREAQMRLGHASPLLVQIGNLRREQCAALTTDELLPFLPVLRDLPRTRARSAMSAFAYKELKIAVDQALNRKGLADSPQAMEFAFDAALAAALGDVLSPDDRHYLSEPWDHRVGV
jgi:hypothetical protein